MKYYLFNNNVFPYSALIRSEDEKEAITIYETNICKLENDIEPIEISYELAVAFMINANVEDEECNDDIISDLSNEDVKLLLVDYSLM